MPESGTLDVNDHKVNYLGTQNNKNQPKYIANSVNNCVTYVERFIVVQKPNL